MKAKTHLQNSLSQSPHCRRGRRGNVRNDSWEGFAAIELLRWLQGPVFFLLVVFYVLGLLLCIGVLSSVMRQPDPPGSVYRSGELFEKLLPEMQSDNSPGVQLSTIWKRQKRQKHWQSCRDNSIKHSGSHAPRGYLIVDANGGLNQQRSSICNAVALAALLNVTLLIPQFQFHNIWMDPSEFRHIYDEDHFIKALKGRLKVVRKLPEFVIERFGHNVSNIPNLKVKAWATANYYLNVATPLLYEHGVIRISPFANRLATEVPSEIQSIRCLTNYKALKFSVPIATMARRLVDRMAEISSGTSGKYVAVHLRFEEDMVAFSCCAYDGGKTEKTEMDSARQRGWREKFKRKGHCLKPGLNRMHGKCPLTPLEVGMMLKGMGFNNNTPIYLASGKIYREEKYLAPLLQLFPLIQTKESLATQEELASFQGYSSRLAALDYTVCLHSEVFVTTQGGNFPHFMMGHRRVLYHGHAKSINPDKRKLAVLLHNTEISWKAFKEAMEAMLHESDRKGVTPRMSNKSMYAYPFPDCSCYQEATKTFLPNHP